MKMIELNKEEINGVSGGVVWDYVAGWAVCGAFVGQIVSGCVCGFGCNLAFFIVASKYDLGKKLKTVGNIGFVFFIASSFFSSVVGAGIGGAIAIHNYYITIKPLPDKDAGDPTTLQNATASGNNTIV